MKKMLIIALLILCSCNFLVYSQEVNNSKNHPDVPMIFVPKNHDPNFLKAGKISEKSFYQRKSEWQHIIDSTWGPGDEFARKIGIFKTYAQKIHDESDVLCFLNMNWDSLYNHYLSQITESTSKGAFSSIMSHFAYDLKDLHTHAWDNTVVFSALNPGVPLLLIGSYISIEHFGAVTTVLPDSSNLILRVGHNHPLNLEPGDIILGYEGIPWKILVRELLNGGLPIFALTGGCKSVDRYENLCGAGLNWHLFNTIDILKYSNGDTVHLSVLPMLNLNLPPMVNNEQLAIQNIPFPHLIPLILEQDTVVTYGILENTNIGYIFLAMEYPTENADAQFYEAIDALKNTDALIIDMRINGGGWAVFDNAFNILFNEYNKTLEHAFRCNTNTFDLCPSGNWEQLQINGKDPDYYDRPIAVLLGPTCVSMGDITAQRLRYHPLVRFFGASSAAAHGWALSIDNISGWSLGYSGADMFHVSEPGVYLNRREFPIDYPVWFNKDDVALGKDPVVEKSLEWINNLVYAHGITTDKWAYSPGNDTVIVNAIIENPNSHLVTAKLYFESLDGSTTDSTDMTEIISKGDEWQGKWNTPGPNDNIYWISIMATDHSEGTYFTSKHSTQISTVPLMIDSIAYAPMTNFRYSFQPFLKNEGLTQTINDLEVNITCDDSWVTSIYPAQRTCGDLDPGQMKGTNGLFIVSYNAAAFPGKFNFTYSISSRGWPFWEIDTSVVVSARGIGEESTSSAYKLNQNYPNPFFTSTDISFYLPTRSFVTLKIYDLGGREVATLVSKELPAGEHVREWNAKELPGGIYFYRLQAGKFTKTRKLVLLK